MGLSATHRPLVGLADRRLRPPRAPGPPLTSLEPRAVPRSVPQRAPGPQKPNAACPHPRPGTGARASLWTETPDDLGPTVRQRAGQKTGTFPHRDRGGRQARPVGRLLLPASNSASTTENATSRSRIKTPQRSHFRPDALLPVGSPSRARSWHPAHHFGHGLTPPKRPLASPLPPAGALEADRRRAQAQAQGRRGRGVAVGGGAS